MAVRAVDVQVGRARSSRSAARHRADRSAGRSAAWSAVFSFSSSSLRCRKLDQAGVLQGPSWLSDDAAVIVVLVELRQLKASV